MAVTIADVCTGLKTVAATATGVQRIYNYDEMPEAVNNSDTPAVIVYWQGLVQDPASETAASTMNAGIMQMDWVFHVDILAGQRNHLNENNEAVVDMADAMINALQTQTRRHIFGVDGAESFHFTAERVVIALAQIEFAAIRFIIQVRVF